MWVVTQGTNYARAAAKPTGWYIGCYTPFTGAECVSLKHTALMVPYARCRACCWSCTVPLWHVSSKCHLQYWSITPRNRPVMPKALCVLGPELESVQSGEVITNGLDNIISDLSQLLLWKIKIERLLSFKRLLSFFSFNIPDKLAYQQLASLFIHRNQTPSFIESSRKRPNNISKTLWTPLLASVLFKALPKLPCIQASSLYLSFYGIHWAVWNRPTESQAHQCHAYSFILSFNSQTGL